MSSPLFVSLKQALIDLRDDLLGSAAAGVTLPSRADGNRALAFMLLASAAIEGFAEERAVEVARLGITRVKSGAPSRTGRALITAHLAKTSGDVLPLDVTECNAHLLYADAALDAYEKMVSTSHGIAGKDLRRLVFPLGLDVMPQQLVDALAALSDQRNPASHRRTPRASRLAIPKAEWDRIDGQLLPLLEQLDDDLDRVSKSA
jgi:hypothetical protein